MKTSFYFVLWILIYPLLDLFNSPTISNNAFFFAIVFVFGLSWLLNRAMPKTLLYERVSQAAPIMEDVYTGNVQASIKRLKSETQIETFTAIYFIVSTVVIGYAVFSAGLNDWIALIVFGLFTYGAVSRSIELSKALSTVKANPTPQQCAETIEDVYHINYAAYYEERQNHNYEEILPPQPRHFKIFRITSIIIAGICILLGLFNIVLAAVIMIRSASFVGGAFAGMYFLYGSLATYFGIKDFLSILHSFKSKTNKLKQH
ncbi:MAG: hypothetical protein NC111_02975 [Bacteroides sp.]|nr:hypothetical protein [Bacteroides sp.]MCM1412813.1 hypothetical protein [Bacteroides sp.]MCM1471482.1 hypothetical protein [Bacteroides sp.]